MAAQMVSPQTLKSRFLRAPRASSQVELKATFSSWPHSGQGLCKGIGGAAYADFPFHGAFSEVPSQLSVLTGEDRTSHAEHDTEHRKQGEERDH